MAIYSLAPFIRLETAGMEGGGRGGRMAFYFVLAVIETPSN